MSNVTPLLNADLLDAYDQLEIEAGHVGWPVSFKTDLTKHDRERLQGDDAPKVFGWVLRELGTLLLDPRMSPRSLEGYALHLESADGAGHHHYWYDGVQLHEIDRERLINLLVEQQAILGGWTNDPTYNSY